MLIIMITMISLIIIMIMAMMIIIVIITVIIISIVKNNNNNYYDDNINNSNNNNNSNNANNNNNNSCNTPSLTALVSRTESTHSQTPFQLCRVNNGNTVTPSKVYSSRIIYLSFRFRNIKFKANYGTSITIVNYDMTPCSNRYNQLR